MLWAASLLLPAKKETPSASMTHTLLDALQQQHSSEPHISALSDAANPLQSQNTYATVVQRQLQHAAIAQGTHFPTAC
jgi:hypothetical protein